MASYEFLEMKKRHPDWIWPRSDTHMVIGMPGSLECYKTWVEPGNSFSPGISSFGVSLWIYDLDEEAWYIPEQMKLESFSWHFLEGKIPVSVCSWETGTASVRTHLFQNGNVKRQSYTDTERLFLYGKKQTSLEVYMVLHSYGACGGFIESVEAEDNKTVQINGFPLVQGTVPYDGYGAEDFEKGEADISSWVLKRELPEKRRGFQENGWCSAALKYQVNLKEGEEKELAWHFPVYLPKSKASGLVKFTGIQEADPQKAEEQVKEYWKKMFGKLELKVPDKRFEQAFYGTLLHMLLMVTGDDVRIETSFYPLFWLRDGVYIINALEKCGMGEMAGRALKRLTVHDFAGGFGSEADAPAEGIWALCEHYRFGRDKKWLSEVYPAIRKKAEWIERMLDTEEDIFDCSTEMVTSFIRACMVCGLVCHPSEDGLIQGVMDHHIPIYWINCWAVFGLEQAEFCAGELGYKEESLRYGKRKEELKEALYAYYPKEFLETPELQGIYSFGCAVWPTQAFPKEMVRDKFEEWWNVWRNRGGEYRPGFDWTYFEAAQAHNYLLLGEYTKYRTMLERYYEYQDVPGMYGYNEGKGCFERGIPVYGGQDWGFGNILPYRGWDLFDCNLPHNWVSAELFLMLRDALVHEEDGGLVIGEGVEEEWLRDDWQEDNRQEDCESTQRYVRILGFPTYSGTVSFEIYRREKKLHFKFVSELPVSRLFLRIPSIGLEKVWENIKELEWTDKTEKGEGAKET